MNLLNLFKKKPDPKLIELEALVMSLTRSISRLERDVSELEDRDFTVDHDELAKAIDLDYLAREINMEDLSQEFRVSDIANEIDPEDIAGRIDIEQLAEAMNAIRKAGKNKI